MSPDLDEVDRAIIYALQEDARNNTNAAISERVGVSASTVGNRIQRLEATGILTGYAAAVDYEAAGFPLEVLFVCTAPIADRADLVAGALDVVGVVNVREMMTGDGNVHVLAVGSSNDDLTRIAERLDDLGFEMGDEYLVKNERTRASVRSDAVGEE
jgi:DNA-binding Lrp family transcriptional regulator